LDARVAVLLPRLPVLDRLPLVRLLDAGLVQLLARPAEGRGEVRGRQPGAEPGQFLGEVHAGRLRGGEGEEDEGGKHGEAPWGRRGERYPVRARDATEIRPWPGRVLPLCCPQPRLTFSPGGRLCSACFHYCSSPACRWPCSRSPPPAPTRTTTRTRASSPSSMAKVSRAGRSAPRVGTAARART